MAKVLVLSTVSRQFHLFERSNIAILTSLGHEVHAAANYADASPRLDGLPIVRHHIDVERSPLSLNNIRALRQLVALVNHEQIEAIHCHSPVGGVLGRLAGRITGVQPVIYTAHGFHFHRGGSPSGWLLYYPVERLLARWTDVLIAINAEDADRAQRFRAGRVVRVPGIGIDTRKAAEVPGLARSQTRDSLGISDDEVLILSVGELNANKNHGVVIRALASLADERLRYVICGQGPMEASLLALARELGVEYQVRLLGYRDDVPSIMSAADIFIHPSLREGLPIALLEAMAAGLPGIVSDVRGNDELIEDGVGGYRVKPSDQAAFARSIRGLLDPEPRACMGLHNKQVARAYDITGVESVMRELYASSIGGEMRLPAYAPRLGTSYSAAPAPTPKEGLG